MNEDKRAEAIAPYAIHLLEEYRAFWRQAKYYLDDYDDCMTRNYLENKIDTVIDMYHFDVNGNYDEENTDESTNS